MYMYKDFYLFDFFSSSPKLLGNIIKDVKLNSFLQTIMLLHLLYFILFQTEMKAVYIVALVWGSILCLDFNYHDNKSLENFLGNMSNLYPNITKLYSIGKTVESKLMKTYFLLPAKLYYVLLIYEECSFDILQFSLKQGFTSKILYLWDCHVANCYETS